MRGIDQALVAEVWRDMMAYTPGRVDAEATEFLARQPHVADFAREQTQGQEPAVQRAAFGLCFLLFKILEASLGRPFPVVSEERIAEARDDVTRWLAERDVDDPAGVLGAADDPAHPTLAGHILSLVYGDAAEYDERVKTSLFLMLRTLSQALDLGEVET